MNLAWMSMLMKSDIKPDNILLNFDTNGTRVVEAKLADCGKPKRPVASIALSVG
jgi:serine/threonine protein kinase